MMGGKTLEEKSVVKPVKSLAVRSQDNRLISMIEFWCQVVTNKLSFRRTLKYYKEQLKMKSRRSRLLILAIADKLNEKEMENVQVKISYCRHQLLAQSLLILTTWSRMCKNQGKLGRDLIYLLGARIGPHNPVSLYGCETLQPRKWKLF